MNKSTLLILSLILSVILPSCSLFRFEGEVTVEAIEPLIHITNDTNRTIYFFACDEDDGALISVDLSDHSDWPKIKAGKTKTIEYSDLHWYDEGDTRLWMYWKTDKGDNGFLRLNLPYN